MRRLATSKDMVFEQSLTRQSEFDLRPGLRWEPPSAKQDRPSLPDEAIGSGNLEDLMDDYLATKDAIMERRQQIDQEGTSDEVDSSMRQLYSELERLEPMIRDALKNRRQGSEEHPQPGPPDEAKGQEEARPKRGRPPGTKNRPDYTKMVDGIEGKPQGPVGAPKPGRTPTPIPLPEDESDREEALYMRVRQILEG